MSFGFGLGDLVALGRLAHDIHEKLTVLKTFDAKDELTELSMILGSAAQKLSLWTDTWVVDQAASSHSFEALWGVHGWRDVQTLLHQIRATYHKIQNANTSLQKGSTMTPLWRRALSGLPKNHKRDKSKIRSILSIARKIDKLMDELSAYSEVAFDSLHTLLLHKQPLSISDRLLDSLVTVRRAAVVLYRAANLSNSRCYLEIDLVGVPRKASTTDNLALSSRSFEILATRKLCYRLITETTVPEPTVEDLAVEAIKNPQTLDAMHVPEIPNLDSFTSSSVAPGEIVCLRFKALETLFWKRRQSTQLNKPLQHVNLSEMLHKDEDQSQKDHQRFGLLHFLARVELAYNMAESAFFLLGTPWLANMDNRKVCKIRPEIDSKEAFFWMNDPTGFENLYLANQNALQESSQLHNIGILLMQLALGTSKPSDSADTKDPHLWASRLLTDVQMVAGTQYSKACAFCIKSHRSNPAFSRHEKYVYSDESGWSTYLQELLEEYEIKVLGR